MRITCFITVCAYLSSAVSTDEIKHLNRKKANLREELALKDVPAEKEINSSPEIYPDIFSTLRKSRSQARIESFQKPRKIREFQPGSQQQQYRHHNRGRSRRLIKSLKTRSIAGASTFELNDNQLKELIPKSIPEIHDEEVIHIEPVFRVTKKKNVFDSIVDILRQLLDPPKNELGPLIGPIQAPEAGRKIYLRLLEPVDSSHVMVRFVTQVQVPVVDAEIKQGAIIPYSPIIDPTAVLLNHGHHGHPIISSDALFSSSNHYHSHYPPRNISFSHTSGKGRGSRPFKSKVLNSPKSPLKDLQGTDVNGKDDFSLGKGKTPGVAEDNKHSFTNAQLHPDNHEHKITSESGSYYQYQSGEEIMNQVKEILNDTTFGNDDSSPKETPKEPLEPWYQLSTHRLPLRQVAPMYALTSMEHTDSSSSSDTYKAPSDVLTGPSSYTSSYEQYNNANTSPGFYASSYDQHYSTPSSYPMSYDKQNNFHPNTDTYSTYQNQNEFNSAPSSYSTSYQNQNELNSVPSSYSSSYEQNDLYSAPSSYSSSYTKLTNSAPSSNSYATSYEKQNNIQTAPSSHDALRVIEPPRFPGYNKALENHANRSSERIAIRQPRYNMHNFNEVSSSMTQNGESTFDEVIWGKTKREKSESNYQKSESNFQNSAEIDGSREKWQPVIFLHEDFANQYEAHRTDQAKVASGRHERKQHPVDRSRKVSRNVTSSLEKEVDQRQNSKRRGEISTIRTPRCSVLGNEDGCERTRSSTMRVIMKTQTQSAANIESIVATTSEPAASNTIETLRLNITMKNPTTSPTSSTMNSMTERPLPLVKTTTSTAVSSTTERSLPVIKTTMSPVVITMMERLIASETSNRPKMKSNKIEKLAVRSTTEKSLINSTTKVPVSNNIAKRPELPQRPMIMKKPAFIMKRMELSGTTRRTVTSTTTQKTTTSSTTKRAMTMKKSKFRGAISKMKSNTT